MFLSRAVIVAIQSAFSSPFRVNGAFERTMINALRTWIFVNVMLEHERVRARSRSFDFLSSRTLIGQGEVSPYVTNAGLEA